MKRSLIVSLAVMLAGVLLYADSHAQPSYDHLKCYKVKDEAKFTSDALLTAMQAQFPTLACTVKGKAKLFCTPVDKVASNFVDKTGGIPQVTVPSRELTFERICYKVKCAKPKIPPLNVSDQFGTRHLRDFKPKMLCTPAQGGKKVVFITSTRHFGNFGGVAAADAECAARASAAGLNGIFLAWLSDSTVTPAIRFTRSVLPYVRVDGTVIADDWADLTDGTLDNPILTDELGAAYTNSQAWTGTGSQGNAGASRCSDWTLTALSGQVGYSNATGVAWTNETSVPCTVERRLYCVEQ